MSKFLDLTTNSDGSTTLIKNGVRMDLTPDETQLLVNHLLTASTVVLTLNRHKK